MLWFIESWLVIGGRGWYGNVAILMECILLLMSFRFVGLLLCFLFTLLCRSLFLVLWFRVYLTETNLIVSLVLNHYPSTFKSFDVLSQLGTRQNWLWNYFTVWPGLRIQIVCIFFITHHSLYNSSQQHSNGRLRSITLGSIHHFCHQVRTCASKVDLLSDPIQNSMTIIKVIKN